MPKTIPTLFFKTFPKTSPPFSLPLSNAQTHHFKNVLRLQKGATLWVFDSKKQKWEGSFGFDQKKAWIQIIKKVTHAPTTAFSPQLNLACALIKPKRMRMIVEKASELGIHTFMPLITQHVSISTTPTHLKKWKQGWEKKAEEAMKQCGRSHPLCIESPSPLKALPLKKKNQVFFLALSAQEHLMFSKKQKSQKKEKEEEEENIRGALKTIFSSTTHSSDPSIWILVGPEGGWHLKELQWMSTFAQVLAFSLPTLTLRTETACIALAGAFQMLFYIEPHRLDSLPTKH